MSPRFVALGAALLVSACSLLVDCREPAPTLVVDADITSSTAVVTATTTPLPSASPSPPSVSVSSAPTTSARHVHLDDKAL
jgi:hypothetical protein